MRSLSLKLTLAFVLVSIIGVALTAVFVRQRTQRDFDQFVLQRYQADLLYELADYYQKSGSWAGIDTIVIRSPTRHRGMPSSVVAAPLTLIDADGIVRYTGLRGTPGDKIPQEQLDRAVPVDIDGQTVGWVQFLEIPARDFVLVETPESEFLANVNQAVLLGALVATLVAVLVGILLARTISRPVREVTAATQVVAGGDLGYQVPVRTRDELGELATAFNKMSADMAYSNEQRLQMTADIAHELRSPLSVILGYMEALNSGKLEPKAETFEIMYARGQHLQRLIEELRTLALADAGELTLSRRPVDPRMLLEHTALAFMVQAQEKQIALVVETGEVLPTIQVDPERMGQVLGNLIHNALRHTPQGGKISLSALTTGKTLQMRVSDTGPGIEPVDLPHIFDRFYRSDKSRQQNGESGLGLAIARSIVEAHGGAITVESTPDSGATFVITLFP